MGALKLNGYQVLGDLVPESTDTMDRVLVLFARYEHFTDPKFYKQLDKRLRAI